MIRNKRGEGYVQVCVLIIAICMILSVFVTFACSVNVVRVTERNVKTVLEIYVTKNSIRIYNSIKQGTNATDSIDKEEFKDDLTSFCTFHKVGSFLYHNNADGDTEYFITMPEINFSEANKLRLVVKYNTYIPLYFAGIHVSTAIVPVTVKINLEGKF